ASEYRAEEEQHEHRQADEPVELTWPLVGGGDEDADQVEQRGNADDVGGPDVDAANDVPHRGFRLDVDHTLARSGRIRVIELGEPNARGDEDEQANEGNAAEGVPEAIGVLRDCITQR